MAPPAIYGPPGKEHRAERSRNRRAAYLKQGICPHCGTNNVVAGKTRCSTCARHNSIRVAKSAKDRGDVLRSRVIRCAYAWWKLHRPIFWTDKEHLENPTVNITSGKDLALAVADWVANKNEE